ncbi:MAG TPA: hypothetical protein VGC11_10530 [Acidimicrobiia bacterium]
MLDAEFSPDDERLAASFVWAPKAFWMFSTDTWTDIAQYVAPPDAESDEAPSHNLTSLPTAVLRSERTSAPFGESRTRSLIQEITVSRVGDEVGGVAFAEDERQLQVTAMYSGELRVITTDVDELLDIARGRVARTFTET